jgi:hypothetical protein
MKFLNFDERKDEIYRFRMSAHFNSMADMIAAIDRHPSLFKERIKSGEFEIVSDVIDGNCVIIKRALFSATGSHYVAYLVDPLGDTDRIRAAIKNEGNFEQQLAWLQSDDFWVNKHAHLCYSDLPSHMYDMTAEELGCKPGSISEQIHARFHQEFAQWCNAKAPAIEIDESSPTL